MPGPPALLMIRLVSSCRGYNVPISQAHLITARLRPNPRPQCRRRASRPAGHRLRRHQPRRAPQKLVSEPISSSNEGANRRAESKWPRMQRTGKSLSVPPDLDRRPGSERCGVFVRVLRSRAGGTAGRVRKFRNPIVMEQGRGKVSGGMRPYDHGTHK